MQEESEREEEKLCNTLVAARDFRGTVDEVGESREARREFCPRFTRNFPWWFGVEGCRAKDVA